jgi:hypothetical protein
VSGRSVEPVLNSEASAGDCPATSMISAGNTRPAWPAGDHRPRGAREPTVEGPAGTLMSMSNTNDVDQHKRI